MERDATEEGEPVASTSAGPSSTKLFLGGLSWETDEDKLRQHFSVYGEISEVVVMRDRMTSKPRGFGFITFAAPESSQRACADAHTLDGRQIDVKPSVPQGESQRPRSKKIFVGGLAPDTTEEQFKTHFEQYGKVMEAQIMVDHTSGRSRGFGFITFDEEASVEKVFNAGSMHELAGKKVEVKNATPKGSGPQRPTAAGRGAGVVPGGRGFVSGRSFGDFPQPGFGVPGYMPGFGVVSYGYPGIAPYGAFPAGMVVAGGYPAGFYPGYGYSQPVSYSYPQTGQPQQQQQQQQQPPGGGASSSQQQQQHQQLQQQQLPAPHQPPPQQQQQPQGRGGGGGAGGAPRGARGGGGGGGGGQQHHYGQPPGGQQQALPKG